MVNQVLQVLLDHQVHQVNGVLLVYRVHQVHRVQQVNQVAMVDQVHPVHRVHVVLSVYQVNRVHVYRVLQYLHLNHLVHHVHLPQNHQAAHIHVLDAISLSLLRSVSNLEVPIVRRSVSRVTPQFVDPTNHPTKDPTKALGCRILNITKYFYRLIFKVHIF